MKISINLWILLEFGGFLKFSIRSHGIFHALNQPFLGDSLKNGSWIFSLAGAELLNVGYFWWHDPKKNHHHPSNHHSLQSQVTFDALGVPQLPVETLLAFAQQPLDHKVALWLWGTFPLGKMERSWGKMIETCGFEA